MGSTTSINMTLSTATISRFWAKVNKSDGCWIWTAGKTDDGYGTFWTGNTHSKSHRISWALTNGAIPEGLQICHHCDNPSCVRPDHLFTGTNLDNQLDSIKKGRHGQKKKSHCPSGHLYSKENTYLTTNGKRMCRECHRARQRNREKTLHGSQYKRKWKIENHEYAEKQRIYARKRYHALKASALCTSQ